MLDKVTPSEPVVPTSLLPYWDNRVEMMVGLWQEFSLDEIMALQPATQTFEQNGPAVGVGVLKPRDYFDEKHAVVVPHPYANGRGPNMHLKNLFMQRHALRDAVQVVEFPNNASKKEKYYEFTQKELDTTAAGDATPMAERIHGALEELGVEVIDIAAYSQGAFVTSALMKLVQQRGVMEIQNVLMVEPTNLYNCSPELLKKGFMSGGLGPFIKSVRDAGIPALTEAQHMRGPNDWIDLAKMGSNALAAQKLDENDAFHKGMTHNTLVRDLENVRDNNGGYLGSRLTSARAEHSLITFSRETMARSLYTYLAEYVADNDITIEGYGHTATDNITGVFSLLCKAAKLGDYTLSQL